MRHGQLFAVILLCDQGYLFDELGVLFALLDHRKDATYFGGSALTDKNRAILFVLESYAHWVILVEAARVVHLLQEVVPICLHNVEDTVCGHALIVSAREQGVVFEHFEGVEGYCSIATRAKCKFEKSAAFDINEFFHLLVLILHEQKHTKIHARIVLEAQNSPRKLGDARPDINLTVTRQLQNVNCVSPRNTDNLILLVAGHCPAFLLGVCFDFRAFLLFF